jgi:predicted nucleic-acid-binding Zn-ribbon protein
MIDYEPYEIERWFEVECDKCGVTGEIEFTAYVWRDGSIYGDWVCPKCGADNNSDNIGNVADFVDHDTREGK